MNILKSISKALDAFFWAAFPKWKAKREYLQKVVRRHLKAASKDRMSSYWTTSAEGPNDNFSDLQTVRARANYLYWNESFIRGSIDLIVNRMIGGGSTPQALTDNEQFNSKAENVFKQWARVADYYDQFHFGDLERLAILKLFLDGGIFFHKVIDKSRDFPFCLEALEYSRLCGMGTPKKDNWNWNGFEIDQTGKIVAYHFWKVDISNPFILKQQSIRIPAQDIIHFSPFRRPGQLMGIPLLAPVIPLAYHLSELLEAELMSAKVAACFGIIIKTSDIWGRMQTSTQNTETKEREIEIAPGMVEHLGPGEEIEVINPKRPGSTFPDFVKIILRGMGRGVNLSYEQISGDKSDVNYSSTRHSELELRDYMLPFRKALERYFLQPIWEDFVKYGIVSGYLQVQGFIKAPENWLKHRWIFKGFDWVDPLKEAQAKKLELQLGLTSLADECAAKGKDWQEIANQRAKEKQYLNDLGLTDISQMQVKFQDIQTRVEVTENKIHVPVPGEEGKHKGHEIRTITISEKKGIQARYCIDCKKIISFIFDKDKWTVSQAKQWVKNWAKAQEEKKAKNSLPIGQTYLPNRQVGLSVEQTGRREGIICR